MRQSCSSNNLARVEHHPLVCLLQLIISPDGVNGLCYEHSASEGIAVIQLMEDLLSNCEDLEPGASGVQPSSSAVQPLQWTIPQVLEKHIRDASQSMDKSVVTSALENELELKK